MGRARGARRGAGAPALLGEVVSEVRLSTWLLAALPAFGAGACSLVIGADFDKPFATGSAGGGATGSNATSSGSVGGAGSTGSTATGPTSSTTGTTSTTSTTATGPSCGGPCITDDKGNDLGLTAANLGKGTCTAGAVDCATLKCLGAVGPLAKDTSCGPMDGDENCDGVRGVDPSCTQMVYIGVEMAMCANPPLGSGLDVWMTNNPADFGGMYQQVASFRIFQNEQPGTIAITSCVYADGRHGAAQGNTCPQDTTNPVILGYMSVEGAQPGYGAISALNVMGHNAFIPTSSTTACCYGGCGVTTYGYPL